MSLIPMRFFRSLLLVVLGLMLVGCAGLPWGRQAEVDMLLVATVAPAASVTPVPLATPRPPRPTATPVPTTTPVPIPSPTLPVPTIEPLPPTPTLAPVGLTLREQIFNQVWTIVRDNYVYEDYRGVDWEAARLEFAPLVAEAENPEVFYALMRELIARLEDDHSRFESPQQVAEQQAEFSGNLRYGGIGALIRTTDEGGLITALAPGGPAERAGLQPRDLIVAVNDIPFVDREAFGLAGPIGTVRGEPGTPVNLTVQRGDEPVLLITVIREAVVTDAFNRVRAQLLPEAQVGLIEIPSFYVAEVDERVREAVEQLLAAGAQGLIIDLRSNAGGYVHLMRNTVALFHDGGMIGSTSGRTSSDEQWIPTGRTIPGMADVPIVLLIGPDTISAAEMFAAGMQVLGRAQVVGEPSAGNTENLYGYSFDDGSRLLIAEVAFRLPDGTLIEERGVIPDWLLEAEWWRFPPEDDPQIQLAREVLLGQWGQR
ncbi:MAG: S41 family peptidase [Oscillochloridaceae bacterium umkhey_bin13]